MHVVVTFPVVVAAVATSLLFLFAKLLYRVVVYCVESTLQDSTNSFRLGAFL